MKRIGIDCRLAGIQHAGIGRYIENLVQRAVREPDIEWVLFFHDAQQAQTVLPGKLANVKRVYVPVKHYSFKEQLTLPSILLAEKLDLLHVPHFNIPLLYPGKMVVTIHDLLWHEQRGTTVTTLPAWQYWLKYLGYRFTVRQAAWRARRIFVPTKTVANTLLQYYPTSKNKIIITPEGVAPAYVRQLAKSAGAEKIEKQVVYTGSLYPHKNVKLIVQALPFLPNFKLVIVGSRTVFQESLRHYIETQGLTSRIEFTGQLSDEKLIALYKKSYALVLPSFSEGFGLPGLEAMAVGLPVVASDIPVFHEVYGEAAAFFDPHSVAELVETLHTLEPSRKILVQAGRRRAKRFSWETMVKQTVTQYRSLLE